MCNVNQNDVAVVVVIVVIKQIINHLPFCALWIQKQPKIIL